MPILRGIVREAIFETHAAEIFGSVERADSALEAAEWALSNTVDHTAHPAVAETPSGTLRALKTQAVVVFPSVVVFYIATQHHIVLQDIMLASPEPGAE